MSEVSFVAIHIGILSSQIIVLYDNSDDDLDTRSYFIDNARALAMIRGFVRSDNWLIRDSGDLVSNSYITFAKH